MLFASDFEDNRVHIDDTHSNQEYYCPYCGAPLVTKRAIFVSTILPINKAMFALIHGLMAVAMVMIFHHGTMSGNPSFPR